MQVPLPAAGKTAVAPGETGAVDRTSAIRDRRQPDRRRVTCSSEARAAREGALAGSTPARSADWILNALLKINPPWRNGNAARPHEKFGVIRGYMRAIRSIELYGEV